MSFDFSEHLSERVAVAMKEALEGVADIHVHEIGKYDFEKALIVALNVDDDGSNRAGVVAPERPRIYLRVPLAFATGNRLNAKGKPYYAERGNSGGWE